jgi:HK97 family phage major capsid protein
MNHSQSRILREDRAKIVVQAQAVLDNKELAGEERNRQFDAMMADADRLKADIDRHEKLEALETETRGRTAPPTDKPENPTDAEQRASLHQATFRSYLRFGSKEEGGVVGQMPDAERRFLAQHCRASVEKREMGTGGGNALQGTGIGYFVPVGFVNAVESALKYYGPMLAGDGTGRDGYPTIMDTATGQPLPWPTDNDTATSGEQIDEHAQVAQGDVTIGSVLFGAYLFSTKMVKVSIAAMQDSAFDLQSYLEMKFGERIGRVVNTKSTTGNGTTSLQGIVTAAALGATATGSATNTGGSETGATTIGSDDLIDLEHSVDVLYRKAARYMMHDTTVAKIKKVKDKEGRPVWQPGLAVNAPDTINGYAYLTNNDMDQVASAVNSPVETRKTVLFGQISKHMIRRVKGLSVLRLEERFADYGQIAFIGFARYDAKLLDAGTNPVKYLAQLPY